MTDAQQIDLPATVTSAGAARTFVTDCVGRLGADEHTDVATLLVSELVTNAVLHANTDITVRVLPVAAGVRVEVHDVSSRVPVTRQFGLEAATGRGLLLVEALANDWGVDPTATGKTVWFEVTAGG